MSSNILIYDLYHPLTEELRYVGKTTQGTKKRLYGHIKDCTSKKDTHLFRWVRQLLSEGLEPKIEVLEYSDKDNLDQAERKWIKHHREIGTRLTNLTEGGTGGATRVGQKNSEYQIKKATEALNLYRQTHGPYRYTWTEEEKKRISERRLGMKFSDEHRANLSKAKTGIVLNLSDGQRAAISKRNSGSFPERGPAISAARKGVYTEAMKTHMRSLHEMRSKMTPEEKRPTAKLTNGQVYDIKRLLAEGRSLNSLAGEFNVSKKCILLIKQGKSYKDIKYE